MRPSSSDMQVGVNKTNAKQFKSKIAQNYSKCDKSNLRMWHEQRTCCAMKINADQLRMNGNDEWLEADATRASINFPITLEQNKLRGLSDKRKQTEIKTFKVFIFRWFPSLPSLSAKCYLGREQTWSLKIDDDKQLVRHQKKGSNVKASRSCQATHNIKSSSSLILQPERSQSQQKTVQLWRAICFLICLKFHSRSRKKQKKMKPNEKKIDWMDRFSFDERTDD